VKRAALLAGLLAAGAGGCIEDVPQPWQLDHDRIVAVRATPPHIVVGEISMLDGLIAHETGATDVEQVIAATASGAPADLAAVIHFDVDHWEVDGSLATEAQLAEARTVLGLPADAPVPLEVLMQFPDRADGQHLIARKTVYLGDRRDNPAVPPITVAGVAPADGATLELPVDKDVPLAAEADATWDVAWLTSCGTMHDFDEHAAFVHVESDDRKQGELAVVVRDDAGGVVWRVWPCAAP
jgi:hypothetical protein